MPRSRAPFGDPDRQGRFAWTPVEPAGARIRNTARSRSLSPRPAPGGWRPGHAVSESPPPAPNAPRLLDRARWAIRQRHHRPRTERVYVQWVRRFILYHGKRHPDEMGEPEVTRFLSSLASDLRVSASTQNQALSAILFLYLKVRGHRLEWLDDVVRAKRPVHLPVVLTRHEVSIIHQHLIGTSRLVASILYGSGLRLLEALRLRIKDVDFGRLEITVRDGKGRRDGVALLPRSIAEPLALHIRKTRAQHENDLEKRAGAVQGAQRNWERRSLWSPWRFLDTERSLSILYGGIEQGLWQVP